MTVEVWCYLCWKRGCECNCLTCDSIELPRGRVEDSLAGYERERADIANRCKVHKEGAEYCSLCGWGEM